LWHNFPLDKKTGCLYNNDAYHAPFGSAMVSTGIFKQDKRGVPSKHAKRLNLKIKRWRKRRTGCLTAVLRLFSRPFPRGIPRPRLERHAVVNMHRKFALVPIMQKRATWGWRLSVTAIWREFQNTDCPRRKSWREIFGQEFNSPRIHQEKPHPNGMRFFSYGCLSASYEWWDASHREDWLRQALRCIGNHIITFATAKS